ncbi:MAG: hypothetical protein ACKO9G_05110, partial [Dolichospermum sp.]
TANPEQDWLYKIEWRPQKRQFAISKTNQPHPRHWLIFADSPQSQELAALLRTEGEICILVWSGEEYQNISPQEYRINPACPEHFRQLLSSLPLIDGIVHTWGLQQSINLTLETLEETALFSCG